MIFTDLLAKAQVQLLLHVRVAITCNLEAEVGWSKEWDCNKFAHLFKHLYNAK